MSRVARKVRDQRLLCLMGRYLRAGVMVDTDLQPSPEGTMQGGPLSPLLANILLDDFDKELESRGLRFVRYADDFLVFTKTREAARRVYGAVGRYLTRKLKLVVNRQKSRICSTDGVEFVGFIFTGYGGQIRVSPKNIKKFKDRVKEITRRKRGVSNLDVTAVSSNRFWNIGEPNLTIIRCVGSSNDQRLPVSVALRSENQ